jgi:hypothetical protein
MIQSIVDKEFGILQHVEDFNGNAFWSGKTTFKSREVDIHFEISTDSPTSKQRDFLKQVDVKYEELVCNVYDVLPKGLKQNKQLADSAYFVEHFKPKAILISKDIENATWSLTLQSMENKKHFLCVDFKGFVAIKSFLEK